MYPQFRRVCVLYTRLRRGIYDFVGSINHHRSTSGHHLYSRTPHTDGCTGGGRPLNGYITYIYILYISHVKTKTNAIVDLYTSDDEAFNYYRRTARASRRMHRIPPIQ